jgi:acyl-coenzyme A thioesterase PaaI-like protein
MSFRKSLQDTFAPQSICFGCGPTNKLGLQIKSFEEGAEIVAEWTASSHHDAFPGVLNGGIIGTLLDCHLNWTAAFHLMKKGKLPQTPCTVTAEYDVKLKRPTPSRETIYLRAKVIESTEDRATVEGTLSAGGKVTATCRGLFVAVKAGHPAYHRW